ncbi:hypothetical protein KO481_29320 [Nocardia sp. NEAU-G5]|uniref:Uncharacterized protein n=1 Tax=Nocardia albiluteola TaxID=2842303 RepID=A0ABS6AWZ3_9NOCA|nr:hypothetical protein [Nocardia albiluteola]MBU3062552.1 hypothetical protein [Nocardia albiluteola]MBU3065614.1 hypothetical protein [Nocardia albiluteola]
MPGIDDGEDVEVGTLRPAVVQLAKTVERHGFDSGGTAPDGLVSHLPDHGHLSSFHHQTTSHADAPTRRMRFDEHTEQQPPEH